MTYGKYEMKDGSFSLFKNDKKLTEKHPDYKGSIKINGVDFNFIDNEGNNLYDYYIQLLTNNYLIYFSQNGNSTLV